MAKMISRRRFVRDAGAAGLGFWALSGSALGQAKPSDLRVALVGLGGRGSWFVGAIPRLGPKVVAVCDVNDVKAADGYQKFPDAARYHDFRRMLDEMEKSLDAVIIATPDHIHAPVAAYAMRRGKHVFVEKPLAHNVAEARALRLIAREKKVATQKGNQGTSSPPFLRAVEHLRSGVLGDLKEVHVWNSGGGTGRRETPQGSQPIPDFLKWDLWLGPAAERPFHRDWMHWHQWRDFGTGNLGNWASHTANLAFMGLNLGALWKPDAKAPLKLEAKVHEPNRVAFPRWERIRYDIPARADLPPVSITWHNGWPPGSREKIEDLLGLGLKSDREKELKNLDFAGLLFVGSKGKLLSTGHNMSFKLLPEEDFRDVMAQPFKGPPSRGHEMDWILACQGGAPALSNFEYSGPLAEFLLLGNVATQFEGALEYDAVEGRIVNNDAAHAALRREYRKGWEL